jgi:hypothetical protein
VKEKSGPREPRALSRRARYAAAMSDPHETLQEAFEAALDDLARRLGGTEDTGGPVVNATQIKGRDDLGVLLTDARDYVLGRVFLAFDAAIPATLDVSRGGDVNIDAAVRSEILSPPLAIDAWLASLGPSSGN